MASCLLSSSTLASGFIDLASYDELATYMYGGEDSITYFVRGVTKSSWFTLVPVQLITDSGCPQFGNCWSAKVTRGGDYLVHNWLRAIWPEVVASPNGEYGADLAIRWCNYPMHNLIREYNISFHGLTQARGDNYTIDFFSAYTVPAGKRLGYDNMVGQILPLTNPLALGSGPVNTLPRRVLNLPLTLPHTRDTGVALPTAALPYNEVTIRFECRNWDQLLIADNIATGQSRPAVARDLDLTACGGCPQLDQMAVWATYAIVSNHERKKMGQAPRDILIEQFQTANCQSWDPKFNRQNTLNFSHMVKTLFFAGQNCTNPNEWSNYTTALPVPGPNGYIYNGAYAVDPFDNSSLYYENTARLAGLAADFYALVNPWYHAISIPNETGYHVYSYSLFFPNVNPMGATDYGKLTSVSLCHVPSAAAALHAVGAVGQQGPIPDIGAGGLLPSGVYQAQKFNHVVVALNHNVCRVTGGAMGFPVL